MGELVEIESSDALRFLIEYKLNLEGELDWSTAEASIC